MADCRRTVKLRTGLWWALVNHPSDLPVLFETRQQAQENREDDEQLLAVYVVAVSPQQRLHVIDRGARRLRARLWHHFRHARGLCGKCGQPNPRHPKWNCEGCAKVENARPRRRRAA